MSLYESLTGFYPVQKTLRWELKPIGKTMDFIVERDIIQQDEHLAGNYAKIKKLIDRMHRVVIEESMQGGNLSEELLINLYSAMKQGKKDEVAAIQKKLRLEIVKLLEKHEWFPELFKKKALDDALQKIFESEEEYEVVGEFKNFYTILTNYNDIRKKIYSPDEDHSTVAYRLIHENLPRYINNVHVYEKLSKYDIDFSDTISKLEKYCGDIDFDKDFGILGFNRVLSQKGIDRYNEIIGGVSTEDTKIQGMNEQINLWNQEHKGETLPQFQPLYKQLLVESTSNSFVIDAFQSDEEIAQVILACIKEMRELLSIDSMVNYDGVFTHVGNYNLEHIYVKNGLELTQLSKYLFKNWAFIREKISEEYDKQYSGKGEIGTDKYAEEKQKKLKKIESFSLAKISHLTESTDDEMQEKICEVMLEHLEILKDSMSRSEDMLTRPNVMEKSFLKDESLVAIIKEFLDGVKATLAYIELFRGSKFEGERDEIFYGEYVKLLDGLKQFDGLYNKVRNYLTRKPFSTDKIALHFNAPTFLDGWDLNREEANLGVIFLKENNFYLGILDSKNRNALRNIPSNQSSEVYKKMEYKQLHKPVANLPRIFLCGSGIEKYAPSDEILRIKEKETFKGPNFNLQDCHKLIDFYKSSIEKYDDWRVFGFQFRDTKDYNDINDFYRDFELQAYKLSYRNIDANTINELVDSGKMYLFQIYSKDFSDFSKGKLNLQTIYWKMIFDTRNQKSLIYKLNGNAEVFYRRASLKREETTIHGAGDKLRNKNPLNDKKVSVFDYELIKNKRYTQDKLFFHCPITINFMSKQQKYVNDEVRKAIAREKENYIIGIDRGERNLLYAVVINSKGKIVDRQQISLNTITNETTSGKQEVNYHDLLDQREKERDKARKNWSTIEQIKDLKSGYLSQAVHVITQLAVKYNALIVLEDLNSDFMRGRQKIEKQVYQNFERMLIQKMNLLVINKERDMTKVDELGGALRAYQLTNKYENLSKIGKQTGVIFYIPAWNTSKIDPTTGFVNLLSKKYETKMEKIKAFVQKFEYIRFNQSENYFEFGLDYDKFTTKATGTKTKWTICTVGRRLENFRNKDHNNMFETKEIYPTDLMKCLLEQSGISYESGDDLRAQLCEMENADEYRELMRILRLTLQMRNSNLASEDGSEDYLQSCVKNRYGGFFNSNEADDTLPRDADANGAYNIARKGLMLVEKIKAISDDEKLDMIITHKDWLKYAQEHC